MSSMIKPVLGSQLEFGHPLAEGLVGYWLMNEGSGNIVQDLSGNNLSGAFGVGAALPTWVGGPDGVALDFDGGDTITVTNKSTLDVTKLTAIIKVKFTDVSANDSFFSRYSFGTGGWELYYSSTPRLRFRVYGNATEYDDCYLAGGPALNTWLTLAAVYDGTNSYLYQNGVLVAQQNTTVMDAISTDLSVGTGAAGPAICQIGYAALFNRALSASEIAKLYREPFCMFEREPIELWVGSVGAAPAGNTGIMTTNTGFWGPTF